MRKKKERIDRVRRKICAFLNYRAGPIDILVLAVTVGLMAGCGHQVKTEDHNYPEMTVETVTQSDGRTYTRYNGASQDFFEVAEDSETVVDVAVHQESGTLRITIQEEDDPTQVVYDGRVFPGENFTVTVKKAGRYRILIHAEDFVGTYRFSTFQS